MLLYLDTKRAPNPRKVRIYLAEKNLDIPIRKSICTPASRRRRSFWPRIRLPVCPSWSSMTARS